MQAARSQLLERTHILENMWFPEVHKSWDNETVWAEVALVLLRFGPSYTRLLRDFINKHNVLFVFSVGIFCGQGGAGATGKLIQFSTE